MTSCSVDGRQTEAHGIPTCLLDTGHTVAPLRSSFYAQPKEQERGVRLSVCLSVTTMSAATASIADVSRTAFTNKDERNKSGKTRNSEANVWCLEQTRVERVYGCVWDGDFF